MKKKERIELAQGYPGFCDGYLITMRDKGFHSQRYDVNMSRFFCKCEKGCKCKPWKLVLER